MIDRRQISAQERRERRCLDRRDSERTKSDNETGIRILRAGESVQALHAELIDASNSGIRMLSSEQVSESESLLVEVRTTERCFNLAGRVVWSEPTEDGRFRIGCDLLKDLPERDFVLLRALLEETECE